MTNCAVSNEIVFEKIEILQPKQQLTIAKTEAPVSLEIKNKSNTKVVLHSNLKMQNEILPNQIFEYRLPKKSVFRIENPSEKIVEIHLKYECSKIVNYQIK